MKKTLRTVLTAAMFAAANLAALPAAAEELKSDEQSSFEGVSQSEFNKWEDITGQMGQMFYGSAPNYDLNDHSNDWKQTTTTADDDEKTTTTNSWNFDFYTTTTTAPELLYGAPYVRRYIGDINMDGAIDSFDMIALRKLLIKGYGQSPASESYSDLNGDKKVNTADLVLLQRYLLGKADELPGGTGYKGFMENVDIEKITSEDQKENVTATTSSIYDPREDIVVSLYGIRPAKDIIDQAIWQTKENIDTEISSEDENK